MHRPLTEYSFLQKLFPLVVLGKVRIPKTKTEEQWRCLLEFESTKLFCTEVSIRMEGDWEKVSSRLMICQTISSAMMNVFGAAYREVRCQVCLVRW